MNRSEFMFQLAQHLADLSQAERSEALKYYQDYFDDAGPENEQNIIEELGSPEAVAASIKEGISSENAQRGEFSERGFTSGFEEEQFDAPDRYAQRKSKFDQVKSEAERRFSNFSGKFEETSGKFENKFNDFSEKYGDKFFGKNQKREEHHTGEYYYGGAGSSSYSGAYDGDGNYTRQGHRHRRRFSGGQIALLVILIICASPILLGVGGGLLGILAGIVFGGFGILVGILGGLLGATLGLFFGGMGGFIGGAVDCFVHPIDGILTCGVSLVCMALGLLLVVFDLWLVTKPLPAFFRWIGRVCRRIFGRKGQNA
ncbi:MAG TPA: DUF1700 domain-containing protein [Candidatus Scybalocola faecipullorum]|nr:DUF1700 domain-containing protein [Candidatus Scybalocola faecipullorum]